ncbi:MAG TPA: glycoside hydrolase family 27 protein [Anaeromyxobacteraceae bacterium]|nr:glycoside hydrolase family 27 protein [Anaeromyxobacteraceae bacterium]
MRSRSTLLAVSCFVAACGAPATVPAPGPTGGMGTPAPSAANPPGGSEAAPAPPPASNSPRLLAPAPPMGWNDWAHFQCRIDEQIVLDNARALVASGLAAKGYDTVTVDDCWMSTSRSPAGDLVADASKFPNGMKWLGDQLHAMGLKFGIYEDAGWKTCGEYPGSGQPQGGGPDHFTQDARLFASWGVDYLKLDGCNVWVPPGQTMEEAYRAAYGAQSAALAATGRDIVFSESAPAYFQESDRWLSVLGWVGDYGQLWRLGYDIQIYDSWNPTADRWPSVMRNYLYTRDLGRFTRPGNWNDPDFIIGGDPGTTFEEARSQFTLWSMMAAPLILSSDLTKVTQSPTLMAILGNADVIAIDQDPVGEAAAVQQAGDAVDVLVKRLANGDRAVAVFNHGSVASSQEVAVDALGFGACAGCTYQLKNLWDGTRPDRITVTLPAHASALFRVTQVK